MIGTPARGVAAALAGVVFAASSPAAAGAAAGHAAGGTDRMLSASVSGDERPLAALVTLLEQRHGVVITYEDPDYSYAGDLAFAPGEVAAPSTGSRPHGLRRSSLSVRYAAPGAVGQVPSLATVVEEAIERHAAAGNPGRFRLEQDGPLLHVIPTAVQGRDGQWQAVHPLLDTKVDLPERDRSLDETLDLIVDAVRLATGVRISIVQVPLNKAKQTHLLLGAAAQSARQVLTRVVSHFGPGFSWRLLFDPRATRMDLQIYDPGKPR